MASPSTAPCRAQGIQLFPGDKNKSGYLSIGNYSHVKVLADPSLPRPLSLPRAAPPRRAGEPPPAASFRPSHLAPPAAVAIGVTGQSPCGAAAAAAFHPRPEVGSGRRRSNPVDSLAVARASGGQGWRDDGGRAGGQWWRRRPLWAQMGLGGPSPPTASTLAPATDLVLWAWQATRGSRGLLPWAW